MVIESIPLEDELGDVLEKAMRHADLSDQALAAKAGVSLEKIRDAFDYRYDFAPEELRRLTLALALNGPGLEALAEGRYPLPTISGLPFCLYPLRMAYGIGVANAYIVADCSQGSGVLFDAGLDYAALRRVWPKSIRKIEAVFVTHTETEHVGGLKDLLAVIGPSPVFFPQGSPPPVPNAVAVGEGAQLGFGGISIQTMQTPGHAESHNCYLATVPRLAAAAPLLVSGDLLFAGSVGGGYFCQRRLDLNLKRMFAELRDETVVAPGHGPLTTIKNERQFNPFVV